MVIDQHFKVEQTKWKSTILDYFDTILPMDEWKRFVVEITYAVIRIIR